MANTNNINGDLRQSSGNNFKNVIEKKQEAPRKSLLKSMRIWIVLLALLGGMITSYAKAIINFAILDMVVLRSVNDNNLETQANVNQSQVDFKNPTQIINFDNDNSCPVDEYDRQRLLQQGQSSKERETKLSSGEKFDWDSDRRGLLKGAFAIGHAPLQILGGRMSEIYGPRWILTLGGAAVGFSCLLAPYSAKLSFYLIFVDLILLGLFVSCVTPSLFTLYARWLTPGEKSMLASFNLVASRVGYASSYLIGGLLLENGYSWRHMFISAGVVAITWALLIAIVVRDWPHEHYMMSQNEGDYLASKNKAIREELAYRCTQFTLETKQQSQEVQKMKRHRKSAPWLAILTSLPVWAFIITKFCVKLAGDTIAIELPTYLNDVMHFPAGKNGQLNTFSNVIFSVASLVLGIVVKVVTKRRPFNLSKTAIRKIFQGIASFGVALGLLVMSLSVCNRLVTELALYYIMIVTTFGTGGEVQLALDMTTLYTATLHSMASSLAVSGFIAPTFIGIFMKGHSSDRNNWSNVWMAASVVSAIGGLAFALFADAEIQPFDSIVVNDPHEQKKRNKKEKVNENCNTDNGKPQQMTIVSVSAHVDKNMQENYVKSGTVTQTENGNCVIRL
ncbi:Sialin [Fragariocoptes setiger]|uniref:Sialin n=1 Tax=Fragariocoptes setiger TaxID=1670756 RepID=A0ABQ7SBA6_9ACAR|nr:Sialin [Fragariocoptes setiger]